MRRFCGSSSAKAATPTNPTIDDNPTQNAFDIATADAVQSATADTDVAAGKSRARAFALFGTASQSMEQGGIVNKRIGRIKGVRDIIRRSDNRNAVSANCNSQTAWSHLKTLPIS